MENLRGFFTLSRQGIWRFPGNCSDRRFPSLEAAGKLSVVLPDQKRPVGAQERLTGMWYPAPENRSGQHPVPSAYGSGSGRQSSTAPFTQALHPVIESTGLNCRVPCTIGNP